MFGSLQKTIAICVQRFHHFVRFLFREYLDISVVCLEALVWMPLCAFREFEMFPQSLLFRRVLALPALPALPVLPALPALPAMPAMPALPVLPALPCLPHLLAVSASFLILADVATKREADKLGF